MSDTVAERLAQYAQYDISERLHAYTQQDGSITLVDDVQGHICDLSRTAVEKLYSNSENTWALYKPLTWGDVTTMEMYCRQHFGGMMFQGSSVTQVAGREVFYTVHILDGRTIKGESTGVIHNVANWYEWYQLEESFT